jgi:hypothetical protein
LETDRKLVFDWSNKQNGALIGGIGIANGLLQRGYVRNAMSKLGEDKMARRGVVSCAIGFSLLAIVPQVASHHTIAVGLLYFAALFMSMTSATVVTSLTAYSSLQCDQEFDQNTGKPLQQHLLLSTGKALGQFRSSGQGGRSLGPLIGWCLGISIQLRDLTPLGSMCELLDIRTIRNLRPRCDLYVCIDKTHAEIIAFDSISTLAYYVYQTIILDLLVEY